jgi:uncharacterized membrane protein YphA (DoxX/SURF4 family)
MLPQPRVVGAVFNSEVVMFWVVLVARVLVGLPFFVFGLDFFLNFIPKPTPQFPEHALNYVGALSATGYLTVVKVLELVGGALVLSGRLVPLGLVLVTPVAVNIALFDIFLVGQPGLGVVLAALCFFLVWAYRSHFAGVFAAKPQIG